ncbi:outer membrane efflux protein BepC precursor [mine drainage metagenome]|uniref:Outer membrane efflux protein BepC n=1 Tax=mine drainage metagenome TaxID=410659 RepID=A0A1J5QFN9_9ZZZZ
MFLVIQAPAIAFADTLSDYVQIAVLKNPEVLASWHNFKASASEVSVARGAYLPHVDLSAGGGREFMSSPLSGSTAMNRSSVGLTLTQMLYDGSATRDQVSRLNHAQLSNYYQLLETTDGAALETVKAYYDVLRNRELYDLTQDNFVYHRTVFEQIQSKVKAGVGRRVDLEQASGRLALSESNLVTDVANIHDVSVRFQRVVGEFPKAKLDKSDPFRKVIPPNSEDAHLAVAIEKSPSILASVENVRAAKMDVSGRQSKYKPRVDFRLSKTDSRNVGGFQGPTNDTVAEVDVSWNLFNGLADTNQISQFSQKLDAARDQRDKVCRDVRQTLAIAYNDIWKLTEQLQYLEQHQLTIEKAKVAYQKQFEIGQRTLLDLLDTENELYSAKRAYVNAEYDLLIAYARTLAGMGQLAGTLGMTRLEVSDLPEIEGMKTDGPEGCPAEAPIPATVSKEELIQRAIDAAKPSEPLVLPGAENSTIKP